ncbi:MAG: hypothetical protein ABIB79_01315 [archaeon]
MEKRIAEPSRLKIKKEIIYICPICDTKFLEDEQGAINCRSKGIIGPEIEPGLILKNLDLQGGKYFVVLGENGNKGHDKKIHLCHIWDYDVVNRKPNTTLGEDRNFLSSRMQCLSKEGKLVRLSEEEFEDISLELFSLFYKKTGKLYREHPDFP